MHCEPTYVSAFSVFLDVAKKLDSFRFVAGFRGVIDWHDHFDLNRPPNRAAIKAVDRWLETATPQSFLGQHAVVAGTWNRNLLDLVIMAWTVEEAEMLLRNKIEDAIEEQNDFGAGYVTESQFRPIIQHVYVENQIPTTTLVIPTIEPYQAEDSSPSFSRLNILWLASIVAWQ